MTRDGEAHLGQTRRLRVVEVVHAVPDGLQDRGERRNTDTTTDQENRLVLGEILRRATERTVDHDTGESLVERRRGVRADELASDGCVALALVLEVAAADAGELAREVADDTDVDRDVVFLRRAGEREGVPLEVGNLGAGQEDVLTGAGGGLFLLDLDFDNLGGVLNNLGDVGSVAGTNFTEDTLVNPDDTANEPVALMMAQGKSSRLCMAGHHSTAPLTQKTPMVLYEQ